MNTLFRKIIPPLIFLKGITKVNHSLLVPLFLNAISHMYISLTNSNRFELVFTKFLDRLPDITYEHLAKDGSTLHVHRNHLIPYYPKEPLLYPHLRSFMRFSDSTPFNIPIPIKYADSDSSPFNADGSMSDEDLSSQFTTPSTNSNYEPTSSSFNDHSTIKLRDNSPFKDIITIPQTDISIDRSRRSSQNQSNSLPPLVHRTTKTHYHLRHQPKIDYRLFIPPSKL